METAEPEPGRFDSLGTQSEEAIHHEEIPECGRNCFEGPQEGRINDWKQL